MVDFLPGLKAGAFRPLSPLPLPGKKRKEEPVREMSRAERIAQKMAARIRASRALEDEYEATLDPRQVQGGSPATPPGPDA